MEERSCLWEQMGKGLGSGAAVVLKTEKKKRKEKEREKQTKKRWNGSFGVLQLVGKPVQTLVQAISAGGTGGLDVPAAMAEGM